MAYSVVIGAGRLADPLAARWCRCSACSCCRKNVPHEDNRLVRRRCKRVYEPVLRWALAQPRDGDRRVALAALLASCALVPQLGSEFLPELNEGSIWVNVAVPAGGVGDRGGERMLRRMRAC